eukprot:TRINITY_DN8497_c0_g1_i1.p1 TRINITY_DN8497_c0_g1~~TRINITY_DN8497_c0_g1_i1.p1  ORF type:complete len:106 (+),score=2.04 TRINITY_DN8497_c0_g1_i1:79-396(+)
MLRSLVGSEMCIRDRYNVIITVTITIVLYLDLRTYESTTQYLRPSIVPMSKINDTRIVQYQSVCGQCHPRHKPMMKIDRDHESNHSLKHVDSPVLGPWRDYDTSS